MTSPFLEAPESTWIAQNALAFAIPDRYPVSRGHTLIVPRRLVESWFDATLEERMAILDLCDEVKRLLDARMKPDGYNIGVNAGEAAGQTVMHLHVHVIPRFRGDVADPRGGVRHVIPERGNWQKEAPVRAVEGTVGGLPPLATGGRADPFLRHIAPLFASADEIAIVAAFVLETGLLTVESHVTDAMERGARARVLTGNYLDITQVAALRRLLAWSERYGPGRFEAKIVDMADLDRRATFHPKSWRFEGAGTAVAFVGSSNISRAALSNGIEWNLRVERERDRRAYREVVAAFERLWAGARPLTKGWIDAYEARIGAAPSAVALAFAEADAPAPHGIQIEALAALARSREEQLRRRAVVVLATGLGKTWLAAFDASAYMKKHAPGRAPRILFLAHREELLAQAEKTLRWMFHESRPVIGYFAGSEDRIEASIVLASVQKLSRPEHLARLAAVRFDYVIVDEVHHGTAASYRAVLDRLDAGFLLGLTATPDRADGADVLGLFDDHVAFRADLATGIQRKLLVPFSYFGLKDDIDYRAIDWQNRRFDPEALVAAVDTADRMEKMWRAWQEHPGTRTVVFCCTIEHAEHARAFLSQKGVRALAIHSGRGSAARAEALAALAAGDVEALCAVDILNEGIDVPEIDRVVMLRPTESPVVFLQQLGRGLRVAPFKERLTVLDFIGNHRIFLARLRMLAAIGDRPTSVHEMLEAEGRREPIEGCFIDIELEAKDLLSHLVRTSPGGANAVERAYDEIVGARGIRPTIGEIFRMGYAVPAIRTTEKGWFDFVARKDGLDEAETRVLGSAREWLRHLESTRMERSFKMVTLEAMLEAGTLTTGMPVKELCRRSYAILLRSPELLRDLERVPSLADPRAPDEEGFERYWRRRKNAIHVWTTAEDGKRWFALRGDDFVPDMPIPAGDEATFAAMTREIVDYRLAQYRAFRDEPKTLAPIRALTAYPSLRAAAGAKKSPVELPPEPVPVRLPTAARGEQLFAVRADGDSMDGGKRPIRDGDWLVMRFVTIASLDDIRGKIALLAVSDPAHGESYQVKRVVRLRKKWILRSENRAFAEVEVDPDTARVVALLEDVVHPGEVAQRTEPSA